MTVTVTNPLPQTSQQTATTTLAASSSRGGKPVRDAELLRRFVRLKDQAAFAELVQRHSQLVHGVCRRVLRSEHDIEDAFQATFLVLARDAARIRKADSLASWLHGVAYRTSLRALDSSRRRGRLLRDVTMIDEPHDHASSDGPFAQVEQRSQQQALDEELGGLPDKYRAPLVLHYLKGKSNQQVAEELDLTVTAVEGRLKRGKKELRLRLARRGVGLSVAVAAMQAVQSTAQAAPLETLIARTIDAGLSYAGGEAAGPVYTPEAARLAGQELAAMSTTSAVTLATVILLPLTLGFAGHGAAPGTSIPTAVVNTAPAQAGAEESEEALLRTDDAAEAADFSLLNANSFRVVTSDDGMVQLIVTSKGGQRLTLNSRIKSQELDPDEGTTQFDAEVVRFSEETQAGEKRLGAGFGMSTGGYGSMYGGRVGSRSGGSGTAGSGLSGMFMGGGIEMTSEMNGQRLPGDVEAAKHRILRFDVQSPTELKTEAALDEQTKVEFIDTPLSDAILYIAQLHNITILLDEVALDDVGIPTDQPVNLIMNGVKLRSVLNLMLRPMDLTTVLRDEVLMITTAEVAEERLETRVYDVSQLALPEEQFIELLQTSVPNAQWQDIDDAGGTASMVQGALVVMQTQDVHDRVVDLLSQLQRHRQKASVGREESGSGDELDLPRRKRDSNSTSSTIRPPGASGTPMAIRERLVNAGIQDIVFLAVGEEVTLKHESGNRLDLVDGFDSNKLTVRAQSPTTIEVEARNPGVTPIELTDESDNVMRLLVLAVPY